MRFDGEVWFDFSSADVWMFYRFVRALAADGHDVALDWRPLPRQDEQRAMGTYVALTSPVDRGRFLHAMLGLVHLEGAAAADDDTVRRAQEAAGTAATDTNGADALARHASDAAAVGVSRVPTLYRHGPATTVVLNAAALEGDRAIRAATILAMIEDDGTWELAKP